MGGLEKIEPGKINYYDIRVQEDLFQKWVVMEDWGGPTSNPRKQRWSKTRRTIYDSYDEAANRFDSIIQQLQQKSYRVVIREGQKHKTMCQ